MNIGPTKFLRGIVIVNMFIRKRNLFYPRKTDFSDAWFGIEKFSFEKKYIAETLHAWYFDFETP